MNSFEPLEGRRFFSADPLFTLTSKGTMIVHGTDGDDQISVQPNKDGKIWMRVIPQGGEVNLYHQGKVRPSVVKRFLIDAGDGDDNILFNMRTEPRPATLLGNAGDDQISGDLVTVPILMNGGDGNDSVAVGRGISVNARKNRDVLNQNFASSDGHAVCTVLGGDGDDTLAGDTNDIVDGGNGNDAGHLLVYNALADRSTALAHDYYARIGALNLESTVGLPV